MAQSCNQTNDLVSNLFLGPSSCAGLPCSYQAAFHTDHFQLVGLILEKGVRQE